MTSTSTQAASPSSVPARWLFALKPASWPKLLVPMLFGQSLGAAASHQSSAEPLVFGSTFTMCGLAFIVLTNDWADRRVDAIKRAMFPDSTSLKTIPDEVLSSRSVGLVGTLCGLFALAAAAAAQIMLGRQLAFAFGLGCVLIFAAYTLPPLRLNYRGGGELLEMIGVGLALPFYNAYLQAGVWGGLGWSWLAGFSTLSLSSAIASGLSDEQSDRAGGKRTVVALIGNARARRLLELFVLLGASCWMVGPILEPERAPLWIAGISVAVILWNFVQMRRTSSAAVTSAFRAQARYKHHLHNAIWHSTTLVALLLWGRVALS